MKKKNISKSDIALYALYLLGGENDYIHFEDLLGKLKITDEGVNKRDQIVIENFFKKNKDKMAQ